MAVQKSVPVVHTGNWSLCCNRYSATWLRSVWAVLRTLLVLAAVLALLNCGITIAARMPRMITTIRISISVNPFGALRIRSMSASLKVRADPIRPALARSPVESLVAVHIELIRGQIKEKNLSAGPDRCSTLGRVFADGIDLRTSQPLRLPVERATVLSDLWS